MQKLATDKLLAISAKNAEASQQLAVGDSYQNFTKVAGLSPALQYILQEVQRELALNPEDHLDPLPVIARISERVGFELSSYERDEILKYLEDDQNSFGVLQKLIDDPAISDIIITDFNKISIQQGRQNFSTDLRFPNTEMYEAYVERLLLKAGSTYSTKKPIADGMIGSLARVHAVHKSLCETGPYLTIRINRFASVDVSDLVRVGFATPPILKYLQAIVRAGNTVMVVGEVGTGKTTLVRALAASMPSEESILVIEDTPEIRLQHPHVRYITTREANAEGAGRVSPSECIRAGMRMAMNRIIFGEIRDAEAAESFVDVCASGHPGISTLHARSAAEALIRLELFLARSQKSVQRSVISDQISTALQVLVHVDICKETKRRRIMDVREIGAAADGVLRQRQIFSYDVSSGIPRWIVSTKISNYRSQIEKGSQAVYLSELENYLELPPEFLLREMALQKVA